MEIEQRRKLPLLLEHFNLPLIAAEVGVAGGAFSQELLEDGIEKIFCVDNWAHIENVTGDGNFPPDFHAASYEEYKKRFSGIYKERVITLKGLSSEMHKHIPDNSLGLVYLDGAHYYEAVKADNENYVHKLVPGGIMAWHDYHNLGYGVKQAVDEFINERHLILNNISEGNPNNASVWVRV